MESMRENCREKLLVYTSDYEDDADRLESISSAAEKVAIMLNVDLEVKRMSERFTPIYVFYKNADEEPIPIYCNKGEKLTVQEICAILRNMMFVLSFHPRCSALRLARKRIMRLS